MFVRSAFMASFVTHWIRSVAIAFAAMFILTGPTYIAAAQGDTSVRVIGRGDTAYEARQDAVRQALQQAVEQLVISQQVVRNDRLVLDKISSTMNGFVKEFTPVRNWREGRFMLIEADVVVSATRITNFVSETQGSRTLINSDNILASVQARKLAQQTRAEILAALFQGFPGQAPLVALPLSIQMNERQPNVLDFETKVQFAAGFISSLREGLRALGARSIRLGSKPSPPNSIILCFPKRPAERLEDCHILEDVDLSYLGYSENWYDASRLVTGPYRYYVLLMANGKAIRSWNRKESPNDLYALQEHLPETPFIFDAAEGPNYGEYETVVLAFGTEAIRVRGQVASADLDGLTQINAVPMLVHAYHENRPNNFPRLLADGFPIRQITSKNQYNETLLKMVADE